MFSQVGLQTQGGMLEANLPLEGMFDIIDVCICIQQSLITQGNHTETC